MLRATDAACKADALIIWSRRPARRPVTVLRLLDFQELPARNVGWFQDPGWFQDYGALACKQGAAVPCSKGIGVIWRSPNLHPMLYLRNHKVEISRFPPDVTGGVRRMTDTGQIEQNWGRSTRSRQIRCPYCVERREFKLMLPHDTDGGYMCANCGHLATPGHPEFKCPCTKCIALNLRSRKRHS